MIWQLRTYRIRPGGMAGFRALWKDHVVPAREELGFVVNGGWFDEDADVFVWLVGHDAPDGWDAVEQAYYANARRETFPQDPREFVTEVETRLLREA